MLDQSDLDIIINFIKLNNHNLFKNTGKNFYQVFCFYCDDFNRNNHVDHGHGNLGLDTLHYFCWRCEVSKSLLQYLIDQGFNDLKIINNLKKLKQSSYIFNRNTDHLNLENFNKVDIKKKHLEFKRRDSNEYDEFLNYINKRCGSIDIIKYGISPLKRDSDLLIEFYNFIGVAVTARVINNPRKRYLKYQNSDYYYFQNIYNILNYKNITISEGIFDIINISNYLYNLKNSFFFAINSRNYSSILKYLLTNYFLIGKYDFHIIFDKDIMNLKNTKSKLLSLKYQYNPEVNINFYIPSLTKDVSDLILIERC
jgi:hypothetical protein